MEIITSRKNPRIAALRTLARDAGARAQRQEFVCDGVKMLAEALSAGREVTSVLWKAGREELSDPFTFLTCPQVAAAEEVFDYASPLVNSPGPVFTVKMNPAEELLTPGSVMVLENVQDPGNVGTVLRTAAAFEIDAVVLTGACADLYNPKTIRATMGAVFRQRVLCLSLAELKACLTRWKLPLYGAVLSERASSVLNTDLSHCALAVGNEGSGLSDELIELCDGEIIIPMAPESESLNASVAASILMWEVKRRRQ